MWSETTLGILYIVDGEVQFSDDFDHWKNGFCRLLEISDQAARAYVERTVAQAAKNYGKLFSALPVKQRIECLAAGAKQCFHAGCHTRARKALTIWGTDPEGAHANTIYAQTISGNSKCMVVGYDKHEFAWLVDAQTNLPVSAESITYDATYYDSGGTAHMGLKDYLNQADWRLEKAARLARTVIEHAGTRKKSWLTNPSSVNVLDLGGGLGYMRKAFADYGFKQYGTEVSAQIAQECARRFGFETWIGGIDVITKFAREIRFNIITLFDVIEHLDQPLEVIRVLKEHLAPDGIVVIRTPNLMAIERQVLADYYYSFKLDHVLYFSPKSLTRMMSQSGFKPLFVETTSHLLKGFLGANNLYKIGTKMKGADIMAIYARQDR